MATIKELMENEEFLVKFVEVATPAELAELLKSNEVELEEGLTVEEAFDLIKKQENAELDVEDLDDVNGGIGLLVGAAAAASFVVSSGMVITLASYGYHTVKKWRRR